MRPLDGWICWIIRLVIVSLAVKEMTPTRHDIAGFWLMSLTAPPILHYFKNPSLPFLQKKMAINVQSSGHGGQNVRKLSVGGG
jgi:hypothetical protein